MGLSEEETARDRLARAAAALAQAEGVAGVRAGGASGDGSSAASGESASEDVASLPGVPWSVSARVEPTGPEKGRPASTHATRSGGSGSWRGVGGGRSGRSGSSGASGRRGRRSATPRSGWGSDDVGERPDWAPPPEDVETAVPEADAESVARAIVLRQLSMAPRSRAQLEKRLRQRGCEDDVAAKVLDRMTEVGLIDDEAYAQMLVRSKQSDKGLARRALAHELRKQGIDQEIADEALGQVGAGDERLRAEQLVAKKLRSMRGLAPEVQTRRLAGLLARKGYSGEVAWPIIRDAVDGLPEHRRD
ncbi:regulatory protein RecX [Terrabacter sp. Ter38]|uniref:regulatory protein RecX n=1 Tax=Terrabacter sp. Ter38 TaxID=2926030 RepID=UPI002118F1D8|nr:regulatory protein RecX [Terrabacter sp. Ter38]